jgi:peptidoglycan hydrolase-like protein with peptidoglycan-binding domain
MAEQRLDLSAGVRKEVQRRLALARFDPQHFDGIFGPATRAALRDWQGTAGIPATGYLNASALALLREQTADDYRAMQMANKARARQQARRALVTSPVPRASPRQVDECSRTPTGEIVYGEGVRCDFRGLRQSIARLFG